MLRKLFIAIAAGLVLQSAAADARSHGARKSAGEVRPHHSRSQRTRPQATKQKRDPAQRRAFQRSHPCPATHKTSGACPGYVVDHRRALKRGGADRPGNMQWQTVAEAKAKDRWE